MERKLVGALALLIVLAPSAILADDTNPPTWRGQPGTTFQHWGFNTQQFGPPDSGLNNPYGTPTMLNTSTTSIVWHPTFGGRGGVWELGSGGTLVFSCPNTPDPNSLKIIWAQITWWADPGTSTVTLTPFGPSTGTHRQVEHTVFADGWTHDTFEYRLDFNPPLEYFQIINNTSGISVFLDQVVLDTWCVPEPASIAALALGLGALARRRRSVSRK